MTGFEPHENSSLQFVTINTWVKFCKAVNFAILLYPSMIEPHFTSQTGKGSFS